MLDLHIDDAILEGIEETSSTDIAIIGMDIKLPKADSLNEFWTNLKFGRDCVTDLSKKRKEDIVKYLCFTGEKEENIRFAKGGYLGEIDKFDYEFFKISYNEAKLMDPNQRIFLENAWKAIEDSGYGGKKLSGTNTGVYVGFTPGGEYRQYVKEIDHTLLPFSETGNLSSIVAARLSYLLDLKGPSMIVNTECSSSLVALHLACRSLRNKEIDTAIVGGVKIAFCPVYTEDKLGVESEKEMIRTFDDNSDGAVFGEGSVALVLKRYADAVQDRDSIYAVIKGSKVNQDGTSIGITAPNVAAQEAVIRGAWQDAGVDPESISYIEAHGTGTSLGDPIEIQGITRAFQKYTRKKQFCGVGSVKTNISHLDNVSGLVSLVKMILAMRKKQLPPSIHFQCPNRNIEFENSAVYVNNRLHDWKTNGEKRRCGVSSFGLSGTNAHVVLEEVDTRENVFTEEQFPHLFVLSSKKKKGLLSLVNSMVDYLGENQDVALGDICYTVATGRGQYNYRLAIVAKTCKELQQKLLRFAEGGMEKATKDHVFYGEHHVISDKNDLKNPFEIHVSKLKSISNDAELIVKEEKEKFHTLEHLVCLAEYFVRGAAIDWEEVYQGGVYWKINLPSYCFESKRCWIEPINRKQEEKVVEIRHPLLDYLVEKKKGSVYCFTTEFSVSKHWVLNEHRIFDKYILPGTSYLEMVREGVRQLGDCEVVKFENIVFVSSLVIEDKETMLINMEMIRQGSSYEFRIGCQDESENWKQVFCEGKVSVSSGITKETSTFTRIKSQFSKEIALRTTQSKKNNLCLGKRWTRLIQKICQNKEEILVTIMLPKEYQNDLNEYYIHPAIYDMAINAISQNIGDDVYLPFSYESLTVYQKTGEKLYSYIRKKEDGSNGEIIKCDSILFHENGTKIAEVTDFIAKRVHHVETNSAEKCISYQFQYVKNQEKQKEDDCKEELILAFSTAGRKSTGIIETLRRDGREVIEINFGEKYRKLSANHYCIDNDQSSYVKLFSDCKKRPLTKILHLCSLEENSESTDEIEKQLELGVYSLFKITKAIVNLEISQKIQIYLISDFVKKINKEQNIIHPVNACLFGFGKVISNEVENITCRLLDVDELESQEDWKRIVMEIESEYRHQYLAYRNGSFYSEIISSAELESKKNIADVVKAQGVYLIVGGMGSLGIRLAREFSRLNKVNLIVSGRKSFEDLENEALQNKNGSLYENLRIYREIQNSESEIHYFSADVADAKSMEGLCEKVKEQYGRIDGVIHAAGLVNDQLIKNKTIEDFKEVLRPKVYGGKVLMKLMQEEKFDFLVHFSSVSAVYGYRGQGDYAAANAYLDSSTMTDGKGKIISINWAPWKDTGMAFERNLEDNGVFKMISSKNAFEALERALCSNYSNILIGEIDFNLLAKYYRPEEFQLDDQLIKRIQDKQDRRKKAQKKKTTNTGSEKILNKVETTLIVVWKDILGIEAVDIYESFLNMGGDSIQAVALMKEVDKKYPGITRVSDVFTYQSIHDMAEYISNQLDYEVEDIRGNKDSEIEQQKQYFIEVLSELENGKITIEEADKLINSRSK